ACSALSFFLSLRPPPLPTLFPYTTLFRSLIQQHAPHLEVDGEMHGDCALDQDTRRQILPDNLLEGSANLLVCPDLDSGNIAYNLLKTSAGSNTAIGPFLLGVDAPVNILTASATVRRIVNMAALTVVRANMEEAG